MNTMTSHSLSTTSTLSYIQDRANEWSYVCQDPPVLRLPPAKLYNVFSISPGIMVEISRSLESKSFLKSSKEMREQRYLELSKPKLSKQIWSSMEPPLTWGNQETIRPLSRAALNATEITRLKELSTPKRDFLNDHPQNRNRPNFVHSVGRSSVVMDVSPFAKKGSASTRVEELSHPKKMNALFKEDRSNFNLGCGRTSPITGVTPAAQKASERDRTNHLAQPKAQHRDYNEPRTVIWPISRSVMNANTSDYTERLAQPRLHSQNNYRDAQWTISRHARRAQASNRVQELSQPKKLNDKYQPTRSVDWRVSRSALRAYATERLQQLSTPIKRETMDHVQYDPLAFQVKETALKGRIPDRIVELAKPIIRQ